MRIILTMPKASITNFANFTGLNFNETPLTSDVSQFDKLTNIRYAENLSVTGSNGFQAIGQPGGFYQIGTYKYYNLATGANEEKVLAINDGLWELDLTGAISIVATSGDPALSFTVTFNSTSGQYEAILSQGGVVILTQALGTGLTVSPYTLLDLCNAIDALATIQCSVASFKYARINGTVIGTVWTVDAGHTIVAGDRIPAFDQVDFRLRSFKVVSVTATTITLERSGGVIDNQVIGNLALPAAFIPSNITTSGNTSIGVAFPYWKYIKSRSLLRKGGGYFREDYYEPFVGLTECNSTEYRNPLFVDANNCSYIFTTPPATSPSENLDAKGHRGWPYKYDQNAVYRAGLPAPKAGVFSAAISGAGVLTGEYKYIQTFMFEDKQGNIIESAPSDEISITLTSDSVAIVIESPHLNELGGTTGGGGGPSTTIAMTAGHKIRAGDIVVLFDPVSATDIVRTVSSATDTTIVVDSATSWNAASPVYRNPTYEFFGPSATINGDQSDATSVTVLNTGKYYNSLSAGDMVSLYDNGVIVRREVTAVTSTSVTFAEGIKKVLDADHISPIRARVYRTKAGGDVFYLYIEVPCTMQFSSVENSLTDNLPDSSLGAEYIDPGIGFEHTPPPRARIAEPHQGGMIYSGIFNQPNAVAYSTSEHIEYVPSTNSFDINSKVTGEITVVSSDNDDRLLVSKETALYDIPGDISGGNFSQLVIAEGDYGMSSMHSVAKCRGVIVGIGPQGPIGVQGGRLLLTQEGVNLLGDLVSSAFIDNNAIDLKLAVAVNYAEEQSYIAYTPSATGLTSAADTDALFFSGDWGNRFTWFDRHNGNASFSPYSLTVANKKLYHLGRIYGGNSAHYYPGQAYVQLKNLAVPAKSYIHHSIAPTFRIRTLYNTGGDPATFKDFIALNLWRFQGLYDTTVDHTMTINTYSDFQTIVPTSTLSVTFSSTDFLKQIKLVSRKSPGIVLELLVNSFFQAPFLSGFELETVVYQKESTRKQ